MKAAYLSAILMFALAACGTSEVEPAKPPPPPPPKVAAPPPPPPPPKVPDTGRISEAESDIARTFDRAYVIMPARDGGASLVTRMDGAPLRKYLAGARGLKFPTILYVHGCAGLSGLTPLRAMARRGFAVIAPDSFSRRFRPRQCDPIRKTGGKNVYVFDFRAAEISYALHRFKRLSWVDRKRLFLVGVSEGGLAVAQYRGDEFRARVIAEWTCHGAPLVRGLAAPPDEPVLAVVRANDPFYTRYKRGGQRGDCGAFFGPRPRSRSMVLQTGARHDVLKDAKSIGAILEFLTEESKRSSYRGS